MIAPNRAPPRILAIDPGSVASGVVLFDPVCSEPVVYAGKVPNGHLLHILRNVEVSPEFPLSGAVLVVEMMRARGMPFSNDEMRTLVWLGRFIEAWGGEWAEVFRQDVKLHLCGSVKARDANIRAALIDRFGGEDIATARVPDCEACHGKGTTRKRPYRSMCLGCSGLRRVAAVGKPKGVKCLACKGRGDVRVFPPRVTCETCGGAGRAGQAGPLYGVTADAWQALALAVTYAERGASVATESAPRGAREVGSA